MSKQKISNIFLDFKVKTESGKIIIFEFKKPELRTKDFEQSFDYYLNEYTRGEKICLIIISISKKGQIQSYTDCDLTFHPWIIKTKKINKQKDLKIIRDKFKNDQKLTITECSLLIALPLFDIRESEAEIVQEICNYIKNKKHCIPAQILQEIVIAMYLNIVEYIEENQQKELFEMIGMNEIMGDIERHNKELIDEGKRSIISSLLNKYSLSEVSSIL